MNRLSRERQAQVVAALVEGCSIRATVRLTGVAKNTVIKLLRDLGAACQQYQHDRLRSLICRRIQCDEIWSFCYAKQKNVPADKHGQDGVGDVWTWVAIDADTKLVLSWLVGRRDAADAMLFLRDVAARLAHRVQVTTDGYRVYLEAVPAAFATEVDFAMLVKLFGPAPESGRTGARPHTVISGSPDPQHVSTSYVERQNLTMRMGMRRFTRKTNAFSKKVENLQRAVALHYMHYNFVRTHQTLRVPPAVEAGLERSPWEIEDIVALLYLPENSSN